MLIINIFKNYKKLGHKEFMRRFNEGVRTMPPQDIVKIQLISILGQIAGMIFAIIWLLILGMWYITIMLAFATVFSVTQLIETWQKYKNIQIFNAQMLQIQNSEVVKEQGK